MCNKSNFQVECHNIFLLSSVPSSSLFIKTHYRLCIYTVPFLLLCMIHSQWYIFIHINLVNICIFTPIISIPDTISYSLAYYYTDWMCPCAFSIFLTHHVYMYITPLLSILLFPQLSLYFLLTLRLICHCFRSLPSSQYLNSLQISIIYFLSEVNPVWAVGLLHVK